MIKRRELIGAIVTIRTDEDCEGPMANEFNGFEIVIESEESGTQLTIIGCHDNAPEFVGEKVAK